MQQGNLLHFFHLKTMSSIIKKDRFYRARGGTAYVLEISCSNCNTKICTYQKDGTGNLHRLYLDRILESNPEFNIPVYHPALTEKQIPNLVCLCRKLIAVPMVYSKEGRLAFRLIHGTIHKKLKK